MKERCTVHAKKNMPLRGSLVLTLSFPKKIHNGYADLKLGNSSYVAMLQEKTSPVITCPLVKRTLIKGNHMHMSNLCMCVYHMCQSLYHV
jgi:hypothetical protein